MDRSCPRNSASTQSEFGSYRPADVPGERSVLAPGVLQLRGFILCVRLLIYFLCCLLMPGSVPPAPDPDEPPPPPGPGPLELADPLAPADEPDAPAEPAPAEPPLLPPPAEPPPAEPPPAEPPPPAPPPPPPPCAKALPTEVAANSPATKIVNICFRMFLSLWIVSNNRREMRAFLTDPLKAIGTMRWEQTFRVACPTMSSVDGRAAPRRSSSCASHALGPLFQANASITRSGLASSRLDTLTTKGSRLRCNASLP